MKVYERAKSLFFPVVKLLLSIVLLIFAVGTILLSLIVFNMFLGTYIPLIMSGAEIDIILLFKPTVFIIGLSMFSVFFTDSSHGLMKESLREIDCIIQNGGDY